MEWIIICNPKYYKIKDVLGKVFDEKTPNKELALIDWKQRNKIYAGDIVYVYACKPIGAIVCKCEVIEVGKSKESAVDIEYIIDHSKWRDSPPYIRIEFKEYYHDTQELELNKLMAYGLRTYRGASRATKDLSKYLSEVTKSVEKSTRKNDINSKKTMCFCGASKKY